MRYAIENIEWLQDDLYYLTVDFYEPGDGNNPSARNDFIIQITAGLDEKVRFDEVIRAYWNKAVTNGWTGEDRSNPRAFPRNPTDPRGLINRPDIQALKGVKQ